MKCNLLPRLELDSFTSLMGGLARVAFGNDWEMKNKSNNSRIISTPKSSFLYLGLGWRRVNRENSNRQPEWHHCISKLHRDGNGFD